MFRTRSLLGLTGLTATVGIIAAGFLVFLSGSPRALAKGKKGDHLRYAKTYQAAVEEARARNAHIFVTFHKDK